jgi:Flp pilus assembly pilin Flp
MKYVSHQLFQLTIAARKRVASENGQALIEYAFILGLVALLTIGVLQAMGANVSGLLNKISTGMSSVTNP